MERGEFGDETMPLFLRKRAQLRRTVGDGGLRRGLRTVEPTLAGIAGQIFEMGGFASPAAHQGSPIVSAVVAGRVGRPLL